MIEKGEGGSPPTCLFALIYLPNFISLFPLSHLDKSYNPHLITDNLYFLALVFPLALLCSSSLPCCALPLLSNTSCVHQVFIMSIVSCTSTHIWDMKNFKLAAFRPLSLYLSLLHFFFSFQTAHRLSKKDKEDKASLLHSSSILTPPTPTQI